jgi:hypothetical protein
MAWRRGRRHDTALVPQGIDRMVWNIEHGRFERALSGLTAAPRSSTGPRSSSSTTRRASATMMMWTPVALTPVAVAAGIAGVASKRLAKTFLPVAAALVAANGLQGTYLHVRGIAQKPGGWRMARYNVEMGPPLFAPGLMTMVGGMGLLAAILRREGC